MQSAHPISSVIPSSHGAVLEILARTETPLSARAIARLTDRRVSHTQANAVLKALETVGIVTSESRPPAYLYTLNRRHVAADAVVALASMRTILFDRMRASISSWDPAPAAAWVFGSFARGSATADSDIDALVIRPDSIDDDDPAWQAEIAQFEQDVRDWSGNDCNTIEFDRREFGDLIESGERLPVDVARDGIHLFGEPIPRGAIRRGQK
ncbi:MAG: nucleotidyltransferase domain-containing protein [Actinomycetota bacterium]|nr:nucleotidyltransferase domain-containing protein [Actinomycetota bacterium]